ncbi:MAG: tetratricopeptide repeat protein [Chitinophagaceae bacterium]
MKRVHLYSVMLVVFAATVGFVIYKSKDAEKEKQATLYALQQRKGPSAQTQEWISTKSTASALLEAIKRNPADTKSSLALASLYIQESRVTGNHIYYDMAAMKYINDVLSKDAWNFTAMVYKALIYLSQHHFSEALATANVARQINPYNAFVYGILVDGNVELGNYTEAVAQCDTMMSIRPDIRSYSRVSYLREIHGDYPGAVEAMKMAVEAGAPGDEGRAWARVQLARLYENTGELKHAEMHYTIALNERPDYAYAFAGLGRIALTSKNYPKAITLYQQADSLLSDYSFKEELAEVYAASGQEEKASTLIESVIKSMSAESEQGQSDENIGHYADRELALAYLRISNYEKALYHALQEYNRRPENIDVNETLAWVYYHTSDYTKALAHLKKALRTNSKNPVLLCRAGLIFDKAGEKNKAKSTLQEALKNNPAISGSLKMEAKEALKAL